MKLTIASLLVLGLLQSRAQSTDELILKGTDSHACFGASEVGGHVFFSLSTSDEYFGVGKESIIYKSNQQLELSDSLDLSYYKGAEQFLVNQLLKHSDSTFLVVANAYYPAPAPPSVHVLIIDTAFIIHKDYSYTTTYDSTLYGMSAVAVDSFIVMSGHEYAHTFHPGFLVWHKNGTLVKKLVIDSIIGTAGNIQLVNNRLLCGLWAHPFYSMLELSPADFSLTSLVQHSGTLGGALFIYGFINSIENGITNPNTIYAYGEIGVEKLALVRMNPSLNVTSIDTFRTSAGKATKVGRNLLDAAAYNRLYFATGEDPVYLASQLQPGLISNMKLWRIDTSGQVIWTVPVKDSAYYLPTKTVATSDGGALFFSMKYDWRSDPSPKTALSIIKLDSNGAFVALHEKELASPKALSFAVYPNPTAGELHLSGIEVRKVAALLVYTVDGVLLTENVNPENSTMAFHHLPTGTYILKVLYKDGRQGAATFVKK